MKLKYDNLDDARAKLVSTFCMYKDDAIVVRNIGLKEVSTYSQETPPPQYFVEASYLGQGSLVRFDLEDPDFNCSNFNIGYLNGPGFASFFYRVPVKQYRQGLKAEQVSCRYIKGGAHLDFKSSKALAAMLENRYPTYEQACQRLIADGDMNIAFNRNFAISRDIVHDDFILEYKGEQIGCSKMGRQFKLMPKFEYLFESTSEVMDIQGK